MVVPARNTSRMVSLDGLRGIAALIVVVHHSLLVQPQLSEAYLGGHAPTALNWLVYSPLHLVWAGGEAVLVFFVLSGLVLTRAAMSPRFELRAYYPSRLLRLYLPVVGAVLLGIVIAVIVPRTFAPGDQTWLGGHADPLNVVEVIRDVVLVTGAKFALNSALWSLQWEVWFSLLLPFFVLAAIRVNGWILIGVALAVSTSGAFIASHIGFTVGHALIYLPMFLIGAVIAANLDTIGFACKRINAARKGSFAWAIIAVIAVLGITIPWTVGGALLARGFEWATGVVGIGATLLVLFAIGSPATIALLTCSPVRWLGQVSFSLYLVHEPIVVSVGILLPAQARWATVVIALPIALLAGWGFFHLVEGPSHRLSQRIARRLHEPLEGAMEQRRPFGSVKRSRVDGAQKQS